MTPERRQQIEVRWKIIDRELAELADGKVIAGKLDPATREGELLLEQDALEYELGVDYFKRRREQL